VRRPRRRHHPCHPIHVDDVARAVVAALDTPPPARRVFVVTGGERVPLGRVVALVRDRIPEADIQLGPGTLSALDRQGSVDITAADRELGYRPRHGLARGIDDYCAWREALESPEHGRRFAA
jgi:nucleoside-diphosphate-sugar epimerase